MPFSRLGNYVRERRQDLGLTQEDLAERIGGGVTQAEVSRLERGVVAFPRRSRLEALAAGLEITLGTLLIQSGWLNNEEAALVDAVAPPPPQLDALTTEAMLADVTQLRDTLQTAIERIQVLTEVIATSTAATGRSEASIPVDTRSRWEISTTLDA